MVSRRVRLPERRLSGEWAPWDANQPPRSVSSVHVAFWSGRGGSAARTCHDGSAAGPHRRWTRGIGRAGRPVLPHIRSGEARVAGSARA